MVNTRVRNIHNYEVDFRYRKNSLGFRDDEFKKTKEKNIFRIFLIGDSIVEGVVVDQKDALDKLLEKKCKEGGLNCEVYNLGVNGTGPLYYRLVAKQFKDYNPDLVIVSICVDNDIEPKRQSHNKAVPTTKIPYEIERVITYLRLHSELWKSIDQFLRTRKIFATLKQYPIDDFYKRLMYQGEINVWIIGRAMAGDNQEYYNHLAESFSKDPPFKRFILAIKETYRNTPFLLLLNPSKYQVNVKYFDPMRKIGFVFKENKVVDRKLQDAIISWAVNNDIEYVDILPSMLKAQNESFFYKFDEHYTAQGNEFAIGTLYQNLQRKGVLPRK